MARAGRGLSLLIAAAAAVCAPQALSLEPGRKIPDLHVEKWYFEDAPQAPAVAPEKASDQLDVIMVFDANAPGAFAFLKLLEAINASNSSQIHSIRAVARNSPKQLDELFARNGKLAFPVAADTPNLATFKDFCDAESMLPMAFVAYKSGVLAWTGHPTGIESVLKRIAEGSFSAESQRRISALRGELQTALQSGLGAVVLKNADRILAIDPSDMIAIQAKLFIYESQGRFQEARAFMAEACAKSPKDSEIRLVSLGLTVRAGDMDAFKAEAAKSFEDFKSSPSFLPKLSAFILDNSPFGEMPVALALESAKAYAASLSASSPSDSRAYAYELLARASYYSCKQTDAVEFQAKACELRKGGPYEAPAAKLLAFYKSVGAK